ncbi:MAG: hypothetical protein ACYCYP_09790 [Leptospirales bacterium]
MKNGKTIIVGGILLFLAGMALYFSHFGKSTPPNHVSTDPSSLIVGNIVSVSGSVFTCPTLSDMGSLQDDSLAHDEIGFRNHFDTNHCKDIPVGPGKFRILKFSSGVAGTRYVKLSSLKTGTSGWFPLKGGTFLKESDH